ncbi:MAG: prolyl aminopeptidase, partial [Betaproteobacteria bacterium]|nr:prolyl aminopeptidase [Betaproteobacteria bacterium]
TSGQETKRFFAWSRTKAPQAWRALNRAAGRGLVSKLFQRCATVFQKGTLARQEQLAVAWNNYERQLLVRKSWRARQLHVKAKRVLVFKYRVQAHYLAHRCWLGSHLLGLVVRRLRQVEWPIVAVHGRFDAVCPPKNVFTVRRRLPSLQVHWIPGGHLEGDPLMSKTLRTALDRIHDLSAPSSLGL